VREHVMLGLRLDEPLQLDGLGDALDDAALQRLTGLGLIRHDERTIALTRRGRFLGGGVTADLLT
jgi:coproporphyrinogen III oxidase-like Fe-S oxidoreductase